MLNIALLICFVALLLPVWAGVCNERTYRQRMKIHKWIFSGEPNTEGRMRREKAVSYDQHLFRLMCFRKPYPNDEEITQILEA